MNAVVSVTRRVIAIGTVVAVAGLGILAHAGGYLLGYTEPAATSDSAASEYRELAYAAAGAHAVGVRRVGTDVAPVDLTVWYPAVASEPGRPAMRYSSSLAVLGDRTATAVATSAGGARLGAPADRSHGPYPLAMLSAGFAITPESYAWLAEHLASYGLVVVAPRHAETLNPANLWRSTIDRPEAIAAARAYVESAAMPGGDLAGLVDTGSVAVLGHSLGGYAALAAGGARIDADTFADDCAAARERDDPIVFLCDALEPRLDRVVAAPAPAPAPVDAVVSLAGDAAMFGMPGLASITAPLLVIGGTADDDSPFAWSTALAYDGASSSRKVEVALDGAGHFVFTNDCDGARRIARLVPLGLCEDPAWDRANARTVVGHYVTAFLLSELEGDGHARAALADPHVPAGVGIRSTETGNSR